MSGKSPEVHCWQWLAAWYKALEIHVVAAVSCHTVMDPAAVAQSIHITITHNSLYHYLNIVSSQTAAVTTHHYPRLLWDSCGGGISAARTVTSNHQPIFSVKLFKPGLNKTVQLECWQITRTIPIHINSELTRP